MFENKVTPFACRTSFWQAKTLIVFRDFGAIILRLWKVVSLGGVGGMIAVNGRQFLGIEEVIQNFKNFTS
ncbi:hypothetical protein [Cerasicoccus fimbriatus]|uniref:hypothetical protein n=1 Tax=Cerasicoccus fimbriatus TaxID=3014554 RepID=UPI0022B3CA10|nr:hypothetical protein [Cerasicoccus sp. TK19100]